jgi:hypothetical protein
MNPPPTNPPPTAEQLAQLDAIIAGFRALNEARRTEAERRAAARDEITRRAPEIQHHG